LKGKTMFQLDNKPLALDVPFTHGGISYPANWLRLASSAERAAIGITEVADPERYDDRFWWGVGNPKQLEDEIIIPEEGETFESYTQKGLKSNWSAQIKDTTNKLLAQTDWMVIRKAERDVAIPAATVAYRAAVLTECDRLLAAIAGAADVDALAAVVGAQNWPEA
jgi:hypothetical protein